MGAYQNPGGLPSPMLFAQTRGAMVQADLDNARREEIAMKIAAQYQGAKTQGQMNPVALTMESPPAVPGQADQGYNTIDQNQAIQAGQQRLGPPVQAAPKQNTQAAAMAPPQLPAGQGAQQLGPPPAPDPMAPPPIDAMPVDPAGDGPQMQAPQESQQGPPMLNQGKVEEMRVKLRQLAMQYGPLTREKMLSQGLSEGTYNAMRGFGPLPEQAQNELLQAATLQVPDNYPTGYDTSDYKMNADLAARAGKQDLERTKADSKPWKQAKDSYRPALQQAKITAMNPISGIINPQQLAEANHDLEVYDAAFTGQMKQQPADPNDAIIWLRAKGEADLQRKISGLVIPQGVPGGSPAPKGSALDAVMPRLPANVKALVDAARGKGVPDDQILATPEVQAHVNKPGLRK